MGPFVTHFGMANAYEPTFLAAEPVLQCEAGTASVLMVSEVGKSQDIPDGYVV